MYPEASKIALMTTVLIRKVLLRDKKITFRYPFVSTKLSLVTAVRNQYFVIRNKCTIYEIY